MPRRHWFYFSEKTPKKGKWICIKGKDKVFITTSDVFYDYDEYIAWCYVNVWPQEMRNIMVLIPCNPDMVVGDPYIVEGL